MYKVYFENRFGDRIFIGNTMNKDEIINIIHADLYTRAKPSFKCHYVRSWINDAGEIIFDVSSHSEFYIAVPDN